MKRSSGGSGCAPCLQVKRKVLGTFHPSTLQCQSVFSQEKYSLCVSFFLFFPSAFHRCRIFHHHHQSSLLWFECFFWGGVAKAHSGVAKKASSDVSIWRPFGVFHSSFSMKSFQYDFRIFRIPTKCPTTWSVRLPNRPFIETAAIAIDARFPLSFKLFIETIFPLRLECFPLFTVALESLSTCLDSVAFSL